MNSQACLYLCGRQRHKHPDDILDLAYVSWPLVKKVSHGKCHTEPQTYRQTGLNTIVICDPVDLQQDNSSTAPSLADFCPGAAAPGQDKLCCWWTSLNTFPPGSCFYSWSVDLLKG